MIDHTTIEDGNHDPTLTARLAALQTEKQADALVLVQAIRGLNSPARGTNVAFAPIDGARTQASGRYLH